MSSEMHRHFHDELNDVKVRLLTMSGEAEAALGLAVDALLERERRPRPSSVITGDRAIDNMEMEIEEACVNLLALQQPMARDLRMLTSALKIANDLERVGDHAVNIAQSAERLAQSRPIAPEPEIVEMARLARDMLSDSLEAFIRGDAAAAREVCLRDDKVDTLHRSVFRILLTHMMEDPHMIGAGMELFLVSRNLERVADLATNVAEDVVFLVEGKSIKHHAEDRGDARASGATPTTERRMTSVPVPEARERLAAVDVGSNSIRLLVAEYGPSSGPVGHCRSKGAAAPGDRRGPYPPAGPRGDRARHRGAQAHARRLRAPGREPGGRGGHRRGARSDQRRGIRGAGSRKRPGSTSGSSMPRPKRHSPTASVAHHFPLEGGRTVIADIGGGSLELIAAVDGLIEQSLSLPFGAVRLTELHMGDEKDTRKAVTKLRDYVRRQFRRKLPLRDWSSSDPDRIGRLLHQPGPDGCGPARPVGGRSGPRHRGQHGRGRAPPRVAHRDDSRAARARFPDSTRSAPTSSWPVWR